jgi:hypothetical protein
MVSRASWFRRAPRRLVGAAAGALALLVLAVVLLVHGRAAPAPVVVSAAPTGRLAPLPAAPERVTLTFNSEPPGAETRRLGDPELLGITPFAQVFPAGMGAEEFEMSKPGYEPARFRIALTADARVGGPLHKLRPSKARAAPAPRRRAPSATRESTLNPFGR